MKYMGSKNRIPILQKCIDDNNIENYYEFFVGGYARNSIEDITGERTKSAIRNLKTQALDLKGIKFSCKNYKDINIGNVKNAVIYLDPSYKNAKNRNIDRIEKLFIVKENKK